MTRTMALDHAHNIRVTASVRFDRRVTVAPIWEPDDRVGDQGMGEISRIEPQVPRK
jgi:hypothetical protein